MPRVFSGRSFMTSFFSLPGQRPEKHSSAPQEFSWFCPLPRKAWLNTSKYSGLHINWELGPSWLKLGRAPPHHERGCPDLQRPQGLPFHDAIQLAGNSDLTATRDRRWWRGRWKPICLILQMKCKSLITAGLIDVLYPAEIAQYVLLAHGKEMRCLPATIKPWSWRAPIHQSLPSNQFYPLRVSEFWLQPPVQNPKKNRQNLEAHHPRRSALAVHLQHKLQQVSQLLRCWRRTWADLMIWYWK